MKQSRRDFLKKLPFAASIPFTFAGVPMQALGEGMLSRMAKASADNDRVLIILQMHGGNDGLNMLVPVEAYDLYYSRRANIAIPAKNQSRGFIPLDSTLPSAAQVGLHPDMLAVKGLYDTGRAGFVQGVSYKNNNGSHFRGRDIIFMGGSSDEYLQSGWIGRYNQGEIAPRKYPEEFPNADYPDPLAIEMGSDISLIFHQEGNIPTSISIYDPAEFAQLVGELEGFNEQGVDPRGIPPQFLQGSPYYKELDWILGLEDKSKDYAAKLFEEYEAGKANNTVTYPENYPFNAPAGSLKNPLSYQLRLIARLLAGGCKTRVFLVKIGGFDTHAGQVETFNPTMGGHAALLYHISTAMKAFQDDLQIRGLEDRVLTVSTSEFGRRVRSNGSFGTDHGVGGPILMFGKGVTSGVTGEVPDLNKENVEMQYDYREVYANIMRNWMLAGDSNVEAKLEVIFPGYAAGFEDSKRINEPLVSQNITGIDEFISDRFNLFDCYPNPAKDKVTLHFKVNRSANVTIELMDISGKKVRKLVDAEFIPGEHKVDADLTGLQAGAYIYQLKSGFFTAAKKLTIKK